jgi:hypothetical protein
MKYGTAELMVPAIVKPRTDTTTATSLLMTFGELIQTRDIVTGQSQMPQGTSRPRSSQMRLDSEEPHSQLETASFLSNAVANSSPIENAQGVEHI